jgi:mono/diheme cytochrome c family protein
MPVPRSLAAALCALPFAAAGCGGGSSDSGASGDPGERLYRQYACASCHSLDGSEGTGPTFKGLAGSTVTLADGERVQATPAYLERAITDPDAQVTEGFNDGLMTASIDAYGLKDKPEDVRRLVEFIQGVK